MNLDVAPSVPAVLLENVEQAARNLKGVIYKTPLMQNLGLSEAYGANIYFKREDLQVVRSYKIRGAYHKIATLTQEQAARLTFDVDHFRCACRRRHGFTGVARRACL